ncbi:MAG TPA: glutamate--tRNA ligase family protein [Desulfurivibrionaceae bacterium]|nr:glutamate--tRNA ligase family protein [Desulfurivibrionaceae bacterium]
MNHASPIRSRIAPTPSGYLHLGNAVNFLLTWLLVRQAGGSLKLRIDDADSDRTQPEYIEDIFHQLDWLGLTWDEGPSGPEDFRHHHSQLLRQERYRAVLDQLAATGLLFPCVCSRKQIREQATNGLYPGTCRTRREPPPGEHAIRLLVPAETVVQVGDQPVSLGATMGDFVLWRRDDQPAYQLASLVDDLDDRISCIVRGADLLASTAAQLHLATLLGAIGEPFGAITFHHHPLIPGEGGQKLSKSDNALSLHAMREAGVTPTQIYQATARVLELPPYAIETLDDLFAVFRGQ